MPELYPHGETHASGICPWCGHAEMPLDAGEHECGECGKPYMADKTGTMQLRTRADIEYMKWRMGE
jgi:transposase